MTTVYRPRIYFKISSLQKKYWKAFGRLLYKGPELWKDLITKGGTWAVTEVSDPGCKKTHPCDEVLGAGYICTSAQQIFVLIGVSNQVGGVYPHNVPGTTLRWPPPDLQVIPYCNWRINQKYEKNKSGNKHTIKEQD